MKLDFERTFFIVDSQIVRAMIRKESYGFSTFVAVRVREIQESTDPLQWYWTEGRKNAADCITRGKKPTEIGQDSKWQEGPDFLKLPISDWSVKQEDCSYSELPERAVVVMTSCKQKQVGSDSLLKISKLSNYYHLLRVTARVMSVYRHKKPSLKNVTMLPNSDSLEEAENYWIRDAQKELDEDLRKGKLKRLRPTTREDGIVVVGARVNELLEMSYDRQELPLLPFKHRMSLLYVEYVHSQGHLGASATACKVRGRSWTINLQRLAKTVRYKCVVCRKLDKRTGQ